MNGVVKRSLTISGHATSISLEEPFWQELRRIAAMRGQSIAGLIGEVDASRSGNLSSALRVFVLEAVRDKTFPPSFPPSSSRT